MIRTAGFLLAAICAAGLVTADEPKPSLKLVNSVLRLTPSTNDAGVAEVLVQAEDFTKETLGTDHPKVEDMRTPPLPAVQIDPPEFKREVSRTDTGAIWLYQLKAVGLPKQTSTDISADRHTRRIRHPTFLCSAMPPSTRITGRPSRATI